MYVVGFNGPPFSGKDTLAQMLVDKCEAEGVTIAIKQDSLSLPLREIAYKMVSLNYQPNEYNYSKFKETEFNLGGKPVTGRQLMIDVSEKFLKPVYSQRIMADLLIERNKNFDGLLLIRDCGFQIEVDPLIEAYGHRNLRIVQVHRKGTSFLGDSREWVFPDLGREFTHVCNDGSLDDLRAEAVRIYEQLANFLGWKL